MRAVLQRVKSAQVMVDGEVVGAIQAGILALIGIHKEDTPADGEWLIKKILAARLFEDDSGKMGRSVQDINGELLVVSQFTLYGNLNKGTRPDFSASMPGPAAKEFYERWLNELKKSCALRVESGRFAAMMDVQLTNAGPVTLILDSRKE